MPAPHDYEPPLWATIPIPANAGAKRVHAGPRFSSIRSDALSSQARRLLRGLTTTTALAIGAAFAVPVSTAQADLIDLAPCNTSVLGQPFAPWGDAAAYELVPGGDFETNTWTLNGRAQRVPGSEPYAATGTLGSSSLALPAGSSAQSPTTCVDAAYPTVRFFIAGTGSVVVTVVEGQLEIPAGIAVAGSSWLPTPVMVTSSPVVAALSGGVALVSLRLTALTGQPRVDDVFMDPWNRG
jgi:hypothetical protein